MRIVPTFAATLCLATAAPALAQTPGVAVDYGALDATGTRAASAPGDTAPVVLKPPLAPVVLTPPPAPKRAVMVVPPPPPPPPPAKVAIPPPPSVPAVPSAVVPVRAPAPVPPAPSAPKPAPQAMPKPTPAAAPALAAAPAAAMLRFAKADSALSPDGRTILDHVAAALAADDKLRLELVAHATGDPDDPVVARRIALQRAIAARTYLMEHGVQSVRMDVRALGDKDAGDGPLDRVDLVLVAR